MTLEEAKAEMPNINRFIATACMECIANGKLCPKLCDTMEKAKKMPFEEIQQAYATHNGMMYKVKRYIKAAK